MEALEEQIAAAIPQARHIRCGPGLDYGVWEDESGANLWLQVRDGALVGAHPFFIKTDLLRLRVETVEQDAESPLDARARAFILPSEEVVLPLDIVNWPLPEAVMRPQATVSGRIAAFAESLSAWGTAEEYEAGHPQARQEGVRWIVPTGLYPTEKGGTGRATAMITGIIRAAEELTNSLTKARFHHLQVETVGATLDAVAAPKSPLPAPGAVVRGHFWLAALVEPTDPESLLSPQSSVFSHQPESED